MGVPGYPSHPMKGEARVAKVGWFILLGTNELPYESVQCTKRNTKAPPGRAEQRLRADRLRPASSGGQHRGTQVLPQHDLPGASLQVPPVDLPPVDRRADGRWCFRARRGGTRLAAESGYVGGRVGSEGTGRGRLATEGRSVGGLGGGLEGGVSEHTCFLDRAATRQLAPGRQASVVGLGL